MNLQNHKDASKVYFQCVLIVRVNFKKNSLFSSSLKAHIIETTPEQGEGEVELATSISVTFNRNVLTVNPTKLFEVCTHH